MIILELFLLFVLIARASSFLLFLLIRQRNNLFLAAADALAEEEVLCELLLQVKLITELLGFFFLLGDH